MERLVHIPGYEHWENIEFIDKGWSSDKKFKVTKLGKDYVVRVFDRELLTAKKAEFSFIKKVYRAGVLCSEPICCSEIPNTECGYMMLSYVEGTDLETALPILPLDTQYKLGLIAGKMLKQIHHIPLENQVNSKDQMQKLITKKLNQLQRYLDSGYELKGQDIVMTHIKEKISLLSNRTICYQHGDYHPGNLIYQPNGLVGVIDFNRRGIGDPYEEFLKLEMFTVEHSKAFAYGQIQGYFDFVIPSDFWRVQKVYAYQCSLFSIIWAMSFDDEEVAAMIERYHRIFSDYGEDSLVIPSWFNEMEAIFKDCS